MGIHHSAAKRDDDGAAPTSPAMLATPLAFRKAPAAPTVLFGNSVNTADSVLTKGYPTMQMEGTSKNPHPSNRLSTSQRCPPCPSPEVP